MVSTRTEHSDSGESQLKFVCNACSKQDTVFVTQVRSEMKQHVVDVHRMNPCSHTNCLRVFLTVAGRASHELLCHKEIVIQ